MFSVYVWVWGILCVWVSASGILEMYDSEGLTLLVYVLHGDTGTE